MTPLTENNPFVLRNHSSEALESIRLDAADHFLDEEKVFNGLLTAARRCDASMTELRFAALSLGKINLTPKDILTLPEAVHWQSISGLQRFNDKYTSDESLLALLAELARPLPPSAKAVEHEIESNQKRTQSIGFHRKTATKLGNDYSANEHWITLPPAAIVTKHPKGNAKSEKDESNPLWKRKQELKEQRKKAMSKKKTPETASPSMTRFQKFCFFFVIFFVGMLILTYLNPESIVAEPMRKLLNRLGINLF